MIRLWDQGSGIRDQGSGIRDRTASTISKLLQLLVCFVLLSANALAGAYDIYYSDLGDGWQSVGPNPTVSGHLIQSGNEFGATVQTGGQGQNSYGSASADGPFEIDLEWNYSIGVPAPIPDAIYAVESSVAYWMGQVPTGLSGSCLNNWADPEYDYYNSGKVRGLTQDLQMPLFRGYLRTDLSEDMLYSFRDAHAEVDSPFGIGTATINHSIQITNIRLVLEGLTDGEILVGQELKAHLAFEGPPPPITSISWSVSDGEPFNSYGVPEWETYYHRPSDFREIDVTIPELRCHFLKPASQVIVSCSFEVGGSEYEISRTLNAIAPEKGFLENHLNFTMGILYITNAQIGYLIELISEDGGGATFKTTTTTPTRFALGPGVSKHNWGSKFFVQTVLPLNELKQLDGPLYLFKLAQGRSLPPICIDLFYPFQHEDSVAAPSSPAYIAFFEKSDSPSQLLSGLVTPHFPFSGNSEYGRLKAEFKVYTMYVPPGENSVAVPLESVHWWLDGKGIQDGAAYIFDGTPVADYEENIVFPAHPQWKHNHGIGEIIGGLDYYWQQ